MLAYLYIDNNLVGTTELQIIDESMGVIGGQLSPNNNYQNYQSKIQGHTVEYGIANENKFGFKLLLDNNVEINSGIGVSDFKDFNEILVEACGLNYELIEKIKS